MQVYEILQNEIESKPILETDKGVCVGAGTAFPNTVYTQAEVKDIFGIKNPVVNKLMDSGHIQQRQLYLPEVDSSTGRLREETPKELNEKFKRGIADIGVKAAMNALSVAEVLPHEVDQIIAVTSSGFAVPGASSILSRHLGMRDSVHRLDIVGMGCNAGMSALYSAAQTVKADPNSTTLLVCVEINSASYVIDETIRTGIVNSLFGDGAAAIVLQGSQKFREGRSFGDYLYQRPFSILDFETLNINEEWEAMRFDYDEEQSKWSFFLSKDIPFVIGENMKYPVGKLLKRNNLDKSSVNHWVMHTGGGAVIDGAVKSIGLTEYDVRHTRSVLRDYGNLSSGSFLVSLERLQQEQKIQAGDLGVLIAMGPGSTIETALVKFI